MLLSPAASGSPGQRLRRWFIQLAALLGILSTLVAAAPPPSTEQSQESIARPIFRAMIVGDSLSQGKDGQHTWRYRFWEYLRSPISFVTPQFVGPFHGTWFDEHNPQTFWRVKGLYAADVDRQFLIRSAFHASQWGRALAWSRDTVGQWVTDHQPDWVLVMMGFNDIAWLGSEVDETVGNMEMFIDNARAAKPDVKFLVANIPHQNFADSASKLVEMTKEFNIRLEGNVTRMSAKGAPESVVRLVDVNTVYGCQPHYCPDGLDGLHPNEQGEYDIARAFSIAMVQLGLTEKPIASSVLP